MNAMEAFLTGLPYYIIFLIILTIGNYLLEKGENLDGSC